jgi:nucleoside-diphosphate-sugar epimerase
MEHQKLSEFSGKNIIVTGATGFIGPHLCEKLAGLGSNVFAVSRNYSTHLDTSKINYESVDLSDIEQVRRMLERIKPNYVFHLAGQAIGSRDLKIVPTTFQSNLVTTLNMLLETTRQKTGRMIITGSLEEPVSDDHEIIPSSPYAISKWAASGYARMFHKLYNTPAVIIRLFMVYGPGRQEERKLIPYVINNLLKDTPPKLSSGNRDVDWVFIDDVVDGLLYTAIADGIDGQTVDIGSGTLVSTRDFVKKIKELMNSSTELLFGSLKERPMEQVRKANIERTFSQIKWKPKTGLEDGLKQTINWYKE